MSNFINKVLGMEAAGTVPMPPDSYITIEVFDMRLHHYAVYMPNGVPKDLPLEVED